MPSANATDLGLSPAFGNDKTSPRQSSSPLRRISKAWKPGHVYHKSSPGRLETASKSSAAKMHARKSSTASQSPERTPLDVSKIISEDTSRVIQTYCARKLVASVIGSVPSLEIAIETLIRHGRKPTELNEQRSHHAKAILTVGEKRLSSTVGGHDRMKFVCACLSLAKDFDVFCRKRQREQQLTKDSTHTPSEQNPPNSENYLYDAFVATQAPVNKEDRLALCAALRFGTKLRVIDAIGISLGLGQGLVLLCAYEYFTLQALPYRAISALRRELQQSWAACNGIKSFSATIKGWWQEYFGEYQWNFSMIDPYHCSL